MNGESDAAKAAKAVLDAVPVPGFLIDRDDRISHANPAAGDLIDGGPGWIAGRQLATVLRQPSVVEAVEECRRSGGRRASRRMAASLGPGGRGIQAGRLAGGAVGVSYVVTAAPLDFGERDTRERDGGPNGSGVRGPEFRTVPYDGSILLSFQEVGHAERTDRMQREFVANVSHELKTPLSAISGFIETLRGPARDDAPARERFLEVMDGEARRMNRLVDDLISLSKVERDARVRPEGVVDVDAILREAVGALRPLLDEASVSVGIDRPESPLEAPGDADQLRQVFLNLLENAVKYGRVPGQDDDAGAGDPTAASGAIAVTLSRVPRDDALGGPAIRVGVIDSGPGIAPAHVPRLTERFYRVDDHRSREVGGTGLGLSIVEQIVNRHRGRLEIDSEPGRGTRVHVMLPL